MFDNSKCPPLAAGEGVIEMIAAALGKRGSGHQALMDVAHDCIGALTDGILCATAKAGARHSQETLERLAEAHDHLVAAGANCDAAGSTGEMEWEGTEFDTGKATAGKLAKMLAGERAEKAALIATLTDIVPRLDRADETRRGHRPDAAAAVGDEQERERDFQAAGHRHRRRWALA